LRRAFGAFSHRPPEDERYQCREIDQGEREIFAMGYGFMAWVGESKWGWGEEKKPQNIFGASNCFETLQARQLMDLKGGAFNPQC
jgi:hypothetical protein